MEIYKSLTGNIPFKEYSLITYNRSYTTESSNNSRDKESFVLNPYKPELILLKTYEANFDTFVYILYN